MKKTFLFLSVLVVSIAVLSCKTETKKQNDLAGKWQNTKVDTISYVLEIAENQEWKYYKNEELLEKGTYAIQENIFVMKHVAEEHDHSHGDEHAHEHPEDHKYEFAFNADKTELSFKSDGNTSTFKKIK